MQMTESLAYMLNLGQSWSHVDNFEVKRGRCRHCIDAVTSNGTIEIKGRAMFYSDEDDQHPLKFGKEAWRDMEESIDGWKEGDILIVNFGAHYSANLMDLRNDLNSLFYEVLAKLPQDKVTIFWRDYAPAHFRSFADGEYPPSHQVKFAGEPACVPHLMAPHTPSIVGHAVTQILGECGSYCAHIRRIPVWDLLRNAWDQHKEGSHGGPGREAAAGSHGEEEVSLSLCLFSSLPAQSRCSSQGAEGPTVDGERRLRLRSVRRRGPGPR